MYTIYFAGDLFDHKHLAGNSALGRRIDQLAQSKYHCQLPQDWEGRKHLTPVETRNKDICALVAADLILVNFDGTDLDSGTVVEFMVAKMLDIPAVMLRTDVRVGGYLGGLDWNLMVAGFPRCKEVKVSALRVYNDYGLDALHTIIATEIIKAFDAALAMPALLTSHTSIEQAYQHVVAMCGSGLEHELTPGVLASIVQRKLRLGVYADQSSVHQGDSGEHQLEHE